MNIKEGDKFIYNGNSSCVEEVIYISKYWVYTRFNNKINKTTLNILLTNYTPSIKNILRRL
jgi:hypothetical protein